MLHMNSVVTDSKSKISTNSLSYEYSRTTLVPVL